MRQNVEIFIFKFLQFYKKILQKMFESKIVLKGKEIIHISLAFGKNDKYLLFR